MAKDLAGAITSKSLWWRSTRTRYECRFAAVRGRSSTSPLQPAESLIDHRQPHARGQIDSVTDREVEKPAGRSAAQALAASVRAASDSERILCRTATSATRSSPRHNRRRRRILQVRAFTVDSKRNHPHRRFPFPVRSRGSRFRGLWRFAGHASKGLQRFQDSAVSTAHRCSWREIRFPWIGREPGPHHLAVTFDQTSAGAMRACQISCWTVCPYGALSRSCGVATGARRPPDGKESALALHRVQKELTRENSRLFPAGAARPRPPCAGFPLPFPCRQAARNRFQLLRHLVLPLAPQPEVLPPSEAIHRNSEP